MKMAFGTVAEALERAGITLEADDYTEPALDQLVTVGSEITVHRVDYQDKVETQTIPLRHPVCLHQPVLPQHRPGHHPAAWGGGSADRDHPRKVCGRELEKKNSMVVEM